jgi:CDP-glycerol glycerophosphotransferase
MKNFLKNILNVLVKILPIDNKKILFQSGRNKVDGNPYAIYKAFKSNPINKYKCIWVVEAGTDVSMLDKGDYAYNKSLKGIISMATSKYLIRSQSIGGIKKRKNQIYIQTWHGAGNFKKCGYDTLPPKMRPTDTAEHARCWDFFIATDEKNKDMIRSSLNYKGEVLVLGNADTDALVNATVNDKINILKKLHLENNKKKLILYAPTFRDDELESKEDIKLPIMQLQALKDAIILIRVHPWMNKKMKNITLPDNFINVGDYPNISDLYLISDVLITDYSSIIFPYMILNKPLVLYPYDYDKYVKLRKGFYLDYNSLPAPICKTEIELFNTLQDIPKISKDYQEQIKSFNKIYNSLNDGNVSIRFVENLKKGTFDK